MADSATMAQHRNGPRLSLQVTEDVYEALVEAQARHPQVKRSALLRQALRAGLAALRDDPDTVMRLEDVPPPE